MKVLVFGSCPLPIETGVPAQGPGIRTWQLIKPACDADHEILAICLRTEGAYKETSKNEIRSTPFHNLTMINFTFKYFTDVRRIRKIAEEFSPDAIVGAASALPNFMASQVFDIAPFWADCFGDPLTEIQAKAEVYGRDASGDELFGVWKYYRSVLSKADRFSALSNVQNHDLVGQLALMGRLNYENAGIPLVFTIPCGVEEAPPVEKHREPILRGKDIPEKAFIVCFSGSYNTWMDLDLMFDEIDKAMEYIPTLYFLSLGGGTKGYNEKLYDDFRRKTEQSAFRDRYLLKGWAPFHEMPRWYAESDIGINVDRFTYEGVTGSRNRIVQFLAHGLPVATTPLCEISRNLAEIHLVYPFRMRDQEGNDSPVESLSELLTRLSANPERLRCIGSQGQRYVLAQYNYRKTSKPLLSWLENPSRSPDNEARIKRNVKYLNPVEEVMDFDAREQEREYLHGEKAHLDKIRRNPLYRLLRFVKRGILNRNKD